MTPTPGTSTSEALLLPILLQACTPAPVGLPDPTDATTETGTPPTPPVEGITAADLTASAGVQGVEFDGQLKLGRTCVVADLDRDGLEDLVVGNPADASYWYRNTSTPGDLSFEPVAVLSQDELWWGISAADVDLDGDLDLAVAAGGFEGAGPNRMLRNDLDLGRAEFTSIRGALDVSAIPGAPYGASVSPVWLDIDGDADLDLWIDETTDPPALAGVPFIEGSWRGRNTLWINEGGGQFVDHTAQANLLGNDPTHWSSWFDFDNDGDLDHLEPVYKYGGGLNHFHLNDGSGRFEDVAETILLDGDDLRYPRETFSSAVADVNNDGWTDAILFVRGQPVDGPFVEGHRLLINVEGRGFVEASGPSGLNRDFDPGFRDHQINGVMGSTLEDINLDGIPDVYIGNGGPTSGWPDQLLLSTGEIVEHDVPGVGTVTVPVWADATSLVDFPAAELPNGPRDYPPYPYRTHAICVTDFDGDGTREAFVVNGGLRAFGGDASREPDRLFSFTVEPRPRRLVVELRGDGRDVNVDAIHARIAVTVEQGGATRTIHDLVLAHNGFGAQHGYVRTIGLGQAERIVRVEVIWPNGVVDSLADVELDTRLDIAYAP